VAGESKMHVYEDPVSKHYNICSESHVCGFHFVVDSSLIMFQRCFFLCRHVIGWIKRCIITQSLFSHKRQLQLHNLLLT